MISSLECFGFAMGFLHQLLQEDELVAVGVSVCVCGSVVHAQWE